MNEQTLSDRTLLYHLWKKHPDWGLQRFVEILDRSIGWVSTWLKRFRAIKTTDDTTDIVLDRDHSRKGDYPHTMPQAVMEAILDLRDNPPASLRRVPGPRAIIYYLEKTLRELGLPIPRSTRTLWRLLVAAKRIIQTVREHLQRLERPGPHEEWQMDYKDVTTVPGDPDGKRQHAAECLNIIDVGTDILLGAQVRSTSTAATLLPDIIAVMREHGMPDSLRFDRDTRFVGSAGQGDFPSALVKILLCIGVQPIICKAHRPDQNGVVERYHRTYGEECLALDQPKTEAEAQMVTDANRQRYNHERPNQSVVCGNQPPCVAHPDLSPRRVLPEQVDPNGWLEAIDGLRYHRKVQSDTSIQIDNHRYYTRSHLVGKMVTVRVDAAARELVVEWQGVEERRVALRGLPAEGPMTLEQLVELRCQEATTEQRWRRQQQRSETTRSPRTNRWINRVNEASMHAQTKHAAAAATTTEPPPDTTNAAATNDSNDIPF